MSFLNNRAFDYFLNFVRSNPKAKDIFTEAKRQMDMKHYALGNRLWEEGERRAKYGRMFGGKGGI